MRLAALHPNTTTALLRRLAAGLGLHRPGVAGRVSRLQMLGAPPGPAVG